MARQYLDYLAREIRLQGALLGKRRRVMQLHLGGGTPTFFDGAELTELMHLIAMSFGLTDSEQREYSIEIDPRTVTGDSLALLKGLGFNRISLGVQDFDPRVQAAINRQQSFEQVAELTQIARLHRFRSVNYDLIYGLPHQSLETLARTLEQVVELGPDRIAFYNYAHLPERFKSQRAIDRHDLPRAERKIEMLTLIADSLQQAGYCFIGMDHFARADDELCRAQRAGTLQRNFQGYSICKAPDLVGLGVSAISSIGDSYFQNASDLPAYYAHLDRGELPIARGLQLDPDDCLRREVITRLICDLCLPVAAIEDRFAIDFSDYFARELQLLQPLEKDGLIRWESATLHVTRQGRMTLRNICMCFDKYLQRGAESPLASLGKDAAEHAGRESGAAFSRAI